LFQHFNLSSNRSLRTLEITAESFDRAGDVAFAANFLKTALSSVTSSATLDIVIIYRDFQFCGVQPFSQRNSEPICLHHSSQETWDMDALHYRQQLEMFREVYKTQAFRLVLCADVSDLIVEHAIEMLQRVVEAGKAMGGLCHLHEPLVISERRILITRYKDRIPGCVREWDVPDSAL
jgi:hypothetical protein